MSIRGADFRRRFHNFPLKNNELICGLVAQTSPVKDSPGIQFEEEQIEWKKKWSKSVITYALIKDSEDIGGNVAEKTAIYLAMMLWNLEIPLELKIVDVDKNPDIKIEFTYSSNDDVFRKNPQMLAYSYFPGTPNQGIIKFNDDKLWSLDGKPKGSTKTFNMSHTLLHEIGHSLGLTHAAGELGKNSVMESSYNGRLALSEYDRLRIIQKYGNRIWQNYQDYQKLKDIMNRGIQQM